MDELKTGDLIMFQGKMWTSYIVQWLTSSMWSHVGIVWRDPPGNPPGVYLLHSDGTIDDFGVQIDLLSKYLDEYVGKVFVYPIQGVEADKFAPIAQIYQETQDTGYDLYPPDIIRILTGGCMRRARTTQYFVCSTYTAYVYERVGLICPCSDWTLVQPKHLVEEPSPVEWQGCSFGSPIQLK